MPDIQIVQGDEVAPQAAVRHRGGSLRARILLEGEPGTPGNFQLSLGLTGPDFVSPRHRHNFEQYRVVLEGRFDFGRDGPMTPGMVGYFPEGAYYGPQSSAEDTVAAVLQFGGVSGNGYLSGDEVEAGMAALQAQGRFEAGVFYRDEGVPGQRRQDAFEAIWEFLRGRAVSYEPGDYAGPLMIDPGARGWAALAGASGVAEKPLAAFADRRTAVRLLRLAAGAGLALRGRGVVLALSGAGWMGGEPARRLTACSVAAGASVALAADAEMVVVHYELPELEAA
jgi:hypothetical protein